MLEIVREHDNERAAAGRPGAVYFLDQFVLNQWQLTKDCTTDDEKREQLVNGLRNSLRACGSLLLCSTAGPEGVGWECPAPFGRVWCLFEIHVAVMEHVRVIVRLAPKDMLEFRQALQRGGMERVKAVLAALDARNASASVAQDKAMILGNIEATVGIEAFNSRVRGSMLAEYKRIATSAGMR